MAGHNLHKFVRIFMVLLFAKSLLVQASTAWDRLMEEHPELEIMRPDSKEFGVLLRDTLPQSTAGSDKKRAPSAPKLVECAMADSSPNSLQRRDSVTCGKTECDNPLERDKYVFQSGPHISRETHYRFSKCGD